MSTEKTLCLIAMVIAGILTLLFILDVAIGVPFSKGSPVFDILAALGGAFILWQGVETFRELK